MSGPSAGRLVWTGQLARGGVVEIQGGRANIGSLTGALPGVAVTLTVHPAEFRSQGLVAYTADPTLSDASEPPAKDNGWNATQLKWDPSRTAEVSIIERPSQGNSFNRLVLRNDGRTWPVLLINWNVTSEEATSR